MSDRSLFSNVTADLLGRGCRVRFRAEGGSMLPTIRGGDLLTVEPVAPADVRRGDVLLYLAEGRPIAHRVVRIDSAGGELRFTLRGDANRWCDEPVAASQVLGRVADTSVRRGALALSLSRSARRARQAPAVRFLLTPIIPVARRLRAGLETRRRPLPLTTTPGDIS